MNGASIELLYKGKVAPLTNMQLARGDQHGRFDGGVYYSSGEMCPLGKQIKLSYRNEPEPLPDTPTSYVGGRHVFGGMLQNQHFGHFISESLSRLWAFSCLEKSFNAAVFYYRNRDQPLAAFATETIKLLLPEITIHAVAHPTQFEVLAVPQQIAHPQSGFIFGHPLVRSTIVRLRQLAGAGSEKIYVSRSKLSPRDGGLLLENFIERSLEAEGYEIVHPQMLSIEEQIKKYNSAKFLIFAEGSALHLYALVARADQKVFVIWRRKVNGAFGWQIETFGGPRVEGLSCVRELWTPEQAGPETVHGRAVLDFGDLRSQLCSRGFVSGKSWDVPHESDVSEALAALSERLQWKFVLHSRP